MLKRLLQVFSTPASLAETNSEERIPLAAAVLFLEVANSDGEFQPEEQAMMGTLLKKHFAVSEESLDDLLKIAEEKRRTSLDLHQFTSEINKAFTQPEKEKIIEALWQLVYADGRLDCYEDALMRQLGALIGVSHRQLIEAKLRVTRS